jgi:hypothetical protein
MNSQSVSIKINRITCGLCRKAPFHGNRYVTLSCRRRGGGGDRKVSTLQSKQQQKHSLTETEMLVTVHGNEERNTGT